MKIISNALYENIPLFKKLEAMPFKKLVKYAYKHYGVSYHPNVHMNKYDLISEINDAIFIDAPEAQKMHK